MAKSHNLPVWKQTLQTQTLSTTTMGTAVALGERTVIGISVDGKTQLAWGHSSGITAGPTYDSYAEANSDSELTLNSGGVVGVGQSFTGEAGIGSTLASAKFYMKKTNSPTGNAVAKVYAAFGTDGVSAIPSGAALATSGNFDVSTLTGSLALVTFTFTGANKIALVRNTIYVVTVEYAGGDGTDNIQVGYDGSSPAHAGNYVSLTGSAWTANAARDTIFYVLITEQDTLLPEAGVSILEVEPEYTHLVLYNPSGAASVITSVFEVQM